MTTVFDYRRHAQECRSLASEMDADSHDELLQMADEWEHLACQRLALVRSNPDLAEPGELDEDGGRFVHDWDRLVSAAH